MLRVLACYTPNGLRQETYRSLVRYVPIGCLEMVNVSEEINTYWLEFRKRWNGKHDLISIEQDNVIDAEMIPSFNACPEPWCVYEYEGPPNMVSRGAPDNILRTGLGCTRFSQQLQVDIPIEEISDKDYFSWYLIDYRIACVLGKKGYSPHVHGSAEHLHHYATDRGRILKEDELYALAMAKTKENPSAVLGHPGMELSDGGGKDAEPIPVITYHKDAEPKKKASGKKGRQLGNLVTEGCNDMTSTGGTFVATALPDAFVGVPYLVGLPVALPASGTVTAVASAGALPPGLTPTINGNLLITGTVLPTGSLGTQVDGAYTYSVTLSNAQGTTVAAALTMNVHYLTSDQDLSVAAQAALRAGEAIDNTFVEDVGTATNVFPTAPAIPTNIG